MNLFSFQRISFVLQIGQSLKVIHLNNVIGECVAQFLQHFLQRQNISNETIKVMFISNYRSIATNNQKSIHKIFHGNLQERLFYFEMNDMKSDDGQYF
jgi:hypothetical protein